MTAVYVALGTIFGFILSRSGAADYDFIQGMFLFTSFALMFMSPGRYAVTRRF